MDSLLFAVFAEFLKLQALLVSLLVLAAMVVQVLADRAFQLDQIILGHFVIINSFCA